MAFSAPMALLADLKARLKIGDTSDDVVLAEMLLAVSGAVEAVAGRPLRRGHCVRERFAGGSSLLRTNLAPIAQIHWIRESYDYDFGDPDAYTELEYGDDYVLEAGSRGELPGETGWVRKVNGAFLGTLDAPGMVEVCYTGGYKTPGEVALENGSLTFDGTVNMVLVDAFSVAARYESDTLDGYLAQFLLADTCKVGAELSGAIRKANTGFVVFHPGNVLIPTWEIVEATLTLFFNRTDGTTDTNVSGFVLPLDPRAQLRNLGDLYDYATALTDGQILANLVRNSASFSVQAMTIHSDVAYHCGDNMARVNATLRQGFLAFAFRAPFSSATLAAGIATPRHATAGNRPSLVLVHRDTLYDPFVMPDDLRHATLVQTANDWGIRRQPGFRQETQRGVSISSGVSYLKDPADLLPEVEKVARSYARFV